MHRFIFICAIWIQSVWCLEMKYRIIIRGRRLKNKCSLTCKSVNIMQKILVVFIVFVVWNNWYICKEIVIMIILCCTTYRRTADSITVLLLTEENRKVDIYLSKYCVSTFSGAMFRSNSYSENQYWLSNKLYVVHYYRVSCRFVTARITKSYFQL